MAALCAFAALAQAQEVTQKTPAGTLRGTQEGVIQRFLGVPYAAAPVGELRWRSPLAPTPWTGVRDARQFGPECMQGARSPAPVAMSEDCLYLNLWVPKRSLHRLPVLVWVHGGAFKVGTAAQPLYDGASLAHQGVLVVTLNYRLGQFGFLAHPALTRENPEGPLGNYGLMDVLAALKWVQANIRAFGGDPKNVTLAGQSAGGAVVYDLMTSPLSAKLFSRAIIESGVFNTFPTAFEKAQQSGAAAALTWGAAATDAAALRRLPAAQVQGDAARVAGDFGPMIDGKVLTEDPTQAFDEGQFMRVPLLIGSNSYEVGFFGDVAKGLAVRLASAWPRVTALYDGYGTHRTDLIEKQLDTDLMVTVPTRTAARASAAHGAPTFLYFYSYVPLARRSAVPGASHVDEVYALFGHMDLLPGGEVQPQDLSVMTAVQERWARFARSGSPASKTQPWPALDLGNQQLLEFGNEGAVVREDLNAQQLDLAAAVAPLAARPTSP